MAICVAARIFLFSIVLAGKLDESYVLPLLSIANILILSNVSPQSELLWANWPSDVPQYLHSPVVKLPAGL